MTENPLTMIEIVAALVLVLAVMNVVLLVLAGRSGARSRELEAALREELRVAREESGRSSRELREDVTQRVDSFRETFERQFTLMRDGNEKKLEQVRRTVDEQLQGMLEKKLSDSFRMVSQRLEAVQKGLGEMRSLAQGVGDLKRVLTNVKTRGTWGEVQLGMILEQLLTQDQYAANVQTRKGSQQHVEFAVRLPGPEDDPDKPLWLPIDSKFPQEDYIRLCDAAESGDADGVAKATAALTRAIQVAAKDIREKYVNPPATTDFAILFLPTEGLYAEILRQPGLVEDLQQKHRVVIAGPTTLSALLNSLRMGFRTLAIEQRSSEVWEVLGAVKNEFTRFSDVLAKLGRQLDTARKTIDETDRRTRMMQRRLEDVEKMPERHSDALLGLAPEPASPPADAAAAVNDDVDG